MNFWNPGTVSQSHIYGYETAWSYILTPLTLSKIHDTRQIGEHEVQYYTELFTKNHIDGRYDSSILDNFIHSAISHEDNVSNIGLPLEDEI
ncbi:hypothetical protein ACS0TY_035073 [Phlomoides rotata]